jgi:hypothetical protein
MNYLRGFIPWIAFAAVSGAGWQWGALTGLVLGAALLVQDRRAGVAADALILEAGTIAYFTALTAFSFTHGHSGLQDWTGTVSLGWLALTAWLTLAVRRPFTLGIARRMTPPEIWTSPVFLRVNTVLTATWAASFTLTAGATAAVDGADLGDAASIAVQVAGFLIPAAITARYPERARARALASATAAAAADGAADEGTGPAPRVAAGA